MKSASSAVLGNWTLGQLVLFVALITLNFSLNSTTAVEMYYLTSEADRINIQLSLIVLRSLWRVLFEYFHRESNFLDSLTLVPIQSSASSSLVDMRIKNAIVAQYLSSPQSPETVSPHLSCSPTVLLLIWSLNRLLHAGSPEFNCDPYVLKV